MSKILLTLFSILILIIGALLVIPSFMDWSKYKDQIKTQVAAATGYQVDINGELRAAILPYPHVNLNKVSIDSAEAKGPFAFQGQVEKASVSLQLFPLLSGNIAVSEVSLISPELTLEEQKFDKADTAIDEDTQNQGGDNGAAPAVQIDRLYLENAKIAYKPLAGEAMAVALPKMELQADTLFGPYTYDGRIIYDQFDIGVKGSAGEYSKDKAMPMNINIDGEGYSFGFSGVADMTKDVAEFQGEIEAKADSLQKIASKSGGDALPIQDQSFALSGFLNGSAKAFKLDNGVFSLGEAQGKASLNASGLDTSSKSIQAGLTFDTALNLDALMSSEPAKGGASGKGSDSKAKANYRFLPETIEIPSGVTGNLDITAPQIRYQEQTIDKAVITAKLDAGKVSGQIKADKIPGGGSVDMTAALSAESTSRNGANGAVVLSNPALSVNGQFAVHSLKTVAVDWLKVADVKTFDNPQMPQSASGQIKARVQGSQATLSSSKLALGDYDMGDLSLAYKNGAEPQIDLSIGDFEGATLKASGTLDQSQGVQVSASHPNAARFIRIFKPDFGDAPNLQQAFSFKGTILKNEDALNVSGMTAKIGSIDATGSLVVNTGDDIPDVKAELAFGNLDTRALITGKKSTATAGGTTSTSAIPKSTTAPWTREAIDTSVLRSMNLTLNAKAQQLVHGPWLINSPVIDLGIRNGVLDINTIKGGLFDGSVEMTGRVEAKQEAQPLSASMKVTAQTVDLDRLVRAALSQNKKRVAGTGSFTMDMKTSGLSSSALIYGLNGDGRIETSDMIVYGIDLAKVTEAISDESLTDLRAVVQGAFKNGQTAFLAVDHPLSIREGTMPVNNFTLVSETANIIANGEVSFARWVMNLTNQVDFTGEYDDLPTVDMTIKGPLNAPQQNVASDVLRSFIMNKYGGKVQKKVQELIGKELGEDSPASGLINNLLGLPQQPKKQEQQAPTPAPQPEPQTTEPAPAVNDNTASEKPQPQQSPEEQLIRGLIGTFGG